MLTVSVVCPLGATVPGAAEPDADGNILVTVGDAGGDVRVEDELGAGAGERLNACADAAQVRADCVASAGWVLPRRDANGDGFLLADGGQGRGRRRGRRNRVNR